MPDTGGWMPKSRSSSSRNSLRFQIRLEWYRDEHAPVRLLICFNQRDKQPRQRRAAAVEDMRKFIFPALRFETQVHPARLKFFAIRAARNFEIAPLPRRPDLNVISLG